MLFFKSVSLVYHLHLAVVLLFVMVSPTFSCEVVHDCYPTWKCIEKIKKFISWTSFQTWLNENQGIDFEIVYSNSTYPIITYTEICTKPVICYDSTGECTP